MAKHHKALCEVCTEINSLITKMQPPWGTQQLCSRRVGQHGNNNLATSNCRDNGGRQNLFPNYNLARMQRIHTSAPVKRAHAVRTVALCFTYRKVWPPKSQRHSRPALLGSLCMSLDHKGMEPVTGSQLPLQATEVQCGLKSVQRRPGEKTLVRRRALLMEVCSKKTHHLLYQVSTATWRKGQGRGI